jgi:hypothetical protein
MPEYKEKSHEELRWEDYQRGDKGEEKNVWRSRVLLDLQTLFKPCL